MNDVTALFLLFLGWTLCSVGCTSNDTCEYHQDEITEAKDDLDELREWERIINERKVVKIYNVMPFWEWHGNTFVFRSNETNGYQLRMPPSQRQKIQDSYEYFWQSSSHSQIRDYDIYAIFDSVQHFPEREAGGLVVGPVFVSYGHVTCLDLIGE